MPGENATSEELSENNDDGDSGSGFKLNAVEKKQKNTIYIPRTQRTTTMLSLYWWWAIHQRRKQFDVIWFSVKFDSIQYSQSPQSSFVYPITDTVLLYCMPSYLYLLLNKLSS